MPDQGRRFPLVEVLIVVAIIFIVASILIARHFHLFLGALMVIDRSAGRQVLDCNSIKLYFALCFGVSWEKALQCGDEFFSGIRFRNVSICEQPGARGRFIAANDSQEKNFGPW